MVIAPEFLPDVKAATYGVFPKRESGQTNVEYALILFLLAIIAASVLIILGGKLRDVLNSVNAQL
jgi:Flp pilus assembly pilin Flp